MDWGLDHPSDLAVGSVSMPSKGLRAPAAARRPGGRAPVRGVRSSCPPARRRCRHSRRPGARKHRPPALRPCFAPLPIAIFRARVRAVSSGLVSANRPDAFQQGKFAPRRDAKLTPCESIRLFLGAHDLQSMLWSDIFHAKSIHRKHMRVCHLQRPRSRSWRRLVPGA